MPANIRGFLKGIKPSPPVEANDRLKPSNMDRPHCNLAGNSSYPLPSLRRTTLQHLLATNESYNQLHNNESSTNRLREILIPYSQAKQIPDCGTAEQPTQPMETNNLKSTFLRFPTKIEALVVTDATPAQTKTPRTPICEIAGVVVTNYNETTSRYKCVCNGTENRCCCRQSPTIPRHGRNKCVTTDWISE